MIGTDSASQAMEVTFAEAGRTLRYYAAPLPGDAMAVIEQDPVELDELVAETGSLASVLRTISVGQKRLRGGPCPRGTTSSNSIPTSA